MNGKLFKSFMEYLDGVAVSSLPEGDLATLHSQSYNVIPLRGQSIKRPWYYQDLISSPEWKGKILLLPDVGKFKIQLKPFDPALLANGIVSRFPSEVTLYKNRNKRINRFLIYSFWRMHSLRGNQHAYWCYSQTLIRTSHCYLVACLHSVDKNIYRKKTLKELRMLLLRINRMRANFTTTGTQFGRQRLTINHGNTGLIVSLMEHYLKFFRIYIPKTETKYRPLGVPVLAWRIFQKMWLPPIFVYTQHKLPDNFHGYIPHRGCGTAWQEILKTVIHAENIYEVDFKQFFPSVDSDFLLSFMVNGWNISIPVACYLYQLNQSLPIFLESKSHDKIHGEVRFTPAHQVSLIENQAKLIGSKLPGKIIKGLDDSALADMDPYYSEQNLASDYSKPMEPLTIAHNAWNQPLSNYSQGITGAWLEAQRVTPVDPNRKLRQELGFKFKGNIGLPQGGTLSPYLSILYLNEVFDHLGKPSDVEFLFYADDGIFYSNNYRSLADWLNRISSEGGMDTLSYYNIRVNFDKSSWVKRKGHWLTSLKFLGLLLIPGKTLADFKLLASTRKGSNLEVSSSIDELTHYEYAESLVFDPKARVIRKKLEALKAYKPNYITATFVAYYEMLLALHKSKISPALFSYGYYLQKIVATSPHSYLYAFFHSYFLLSGESREDFDRFHKILASNEEEFPEFEELKLNFSEDDISL